MGKLEDVEAEKKLWESDDAWELRKAFMLAHYDDYPKFVSALADNSEK